MTIHQVGLQQGTPFLVLELLHGETLEDHLARTGRLSVPEIIRIGREIAEGLAAAHARGLLHRDIKPANIWLERPRASNPVNPLRDTSPQLGGRVDPPQAESPSGRVKILDFGLAKLWSAEPEISHAGMMIGTPRYMAPEQVAGDAVDPRTDLFSLGCVLYRMATGRAPFGGSDLLSVLRALACEEPPPVRTLNPQVPAALSDLISQLISKSPDRRPPSVQVVVDALQEIADDLAAGKEVDQPATGPVTRDPGDIRGPGVTWLVGAAIGLMILLPLGYLFGAQLIRIATNKGQVVIEIDDPLVVVMMQENHVAILDRPGQREITLAAGEHQLEVTVKEPTGENTFTTDRFTLRRGGRKVIDVQQELAKVVASRTPLVPERSESRSSGTMTKGPTPQIPAAPDLDRRAASWVLSLAGSATVRVGGEAKPISIERANDLPASDFELTGVRLQKCAVTDAGLEHLRSLTKLVELDLSGTTVTDAGLARLEGLKQLNALDLGGTRVTDRGLPQLRRFPMLRSLNLCLLPVTDAGLAYVGALKNLQDLRLIKTCA